MHASVWNCLDIILVSVGCVTWYVAIPWPCWHILQEKMLEHWSGGVSMKEKERMRKKGKGEEKKRRGNKSKGNKRKGERGKSFWPSRDLLHKPTSPLSYRLRVELHVPYIHHKSQFAWPAWLHVALLALPIRIWKLVQLVSSRPIYMLTRTDTHEIMVAKLLYCTQRMQV